MAEPHLYAVDSNGETTPPAPPPPPEDKRPGRSQPKARPIFAVPTDRLKFDTQVEALRVVCAASRNGTEAVDAEKMASYMHLSPATAPLNNAFFVSVKLLEKAGKGTYKPTPLALKFQQKWTFDKQAAPAILADAFLDTWFFDAVKQRLEVGPTTVEQMVETLAGIAQTDNSYATQYGFLLEWLRYVGLVSLDGGMVSLTDAAAKTINVAPQPEPAAGEGEGDDQLGNDNTPEPEVERQAPQRPPVPQAAPPVVSLSFDVTLTAEDLRALTAEQITSLFDGIGKVAAIKAALAG